MVLEEFRWMCAGKGTRDIQMSEREQVIERILALTDEQVQVLIERLQAEIFDRE